MTEDRTKSITQAWREFRDKDSTGTTLYEHFYPRVIKEAQKKLPSRDDAEDVAQIVLATFFRRALKGDFDSVDGSCRLWGLLKKITICRRANYWRDVLEKKRAVEVSEGDLGEQVSLEDFADATSAAEFARALRELLEQLQEPVLVQIALWKLDRRTNSWIAEQLGVSEATVRRKLDLMFEKLSEDG